MKTIKFIDVQDDPSYDMIRNSKIPVPKFVYNSVASTEKYAAYEPDKFAVIIDNGTGDLVKKYPIATDTDVWLSTFYFEKSASELPIDVYLSVGTKLAAEYEARGLSNIQPLATFYLTKLASEVYNGKPITGPVIVTTKDADKSPILKKYIMKKAEELSTKQRNNLPDSAFAVVATVKGKKVRKYPVHDKPHVLAALKYAKNLEKLPPSLRASAARKIRSAAKKYGINISEDNYVNKYASDTYAPDLEKQVQRRFYFVDPDKTYQYKQLLEKKAEMAPEEFATELARLDINTKVASLWDKVIYNPYETVLGIRKIATETELEQQFLDNVDKLQNKSAQLSTYLGEDLVKRLTENHDIFSTLPESVQELIVSLLQS